MACSYAVTTHVVAIFRQQTGGRVTFRKYDNDSNARRRGEYKVVTARRLWTRCAMTAITTDGSALHCAIQAFRSRVALRTRRWILRVTRRRGGE